ncbi:MAG: hypothetical protein DSO07_08475 [Thermoproteota archaeon]|jgi:hypothetical protein|uniref:Uncharacterized protein n=1 Tax=Candidatus Methanodesulfokora washburnensis TaxID=2478471 RepID=A0A429GF48_9CREN|nr:hypothetical protein [Candidatus Methanodesulfokores washburnensis]RSN72296.1 hypothetical protein D6D85_14250 [Candidatus Methanodesulfokores washburnensis]RZN61657.1 MAG: hypothetical protein EF810_04575 [Candidatus Methanodesulfokores washburnensis]TDA40683.1 MAG: hypothetical protein DSO07_08475 [Candidatus Korarchaeota archaeon]
MPELSGLWTKIKTDRKAAVGFLVGFTTLIFLSFFVLLHIRKHSIASALYVSFLFSNFVSSISLISLRRIVDKKVLIGFIIWVAFSVLIVSLLLPGDWISLISLSIAPATVIIILILYFAITKNQRVHEEARFAS